MTKQRLWSIIAVAAIIVIIVPIIILAFVRTNFNQVNTNRDQIVQISVWHGTSHGVFDRDRDAEIFDEILRLYRRGTSEGILSALFQGAYGSRGRAEVITADRNFNPGGDRVYIAFHYDSENLPRITLNGNVWEDETRPANADNRTIEYNTVWIQIANDNSLTGTTVWFREAGTTNAANFSRYHMNTISSHRPLFTYIVETLLEYNHLS